MWTSFNQPNVGTCKHNNKPLSGFYTRWGIFLCSLVAITSQDQLRCMGIRVFWDVMCSLVDM